MRDNKFNELVYKCEQSLSELRRVVDHRTREAKEQIVLSMKDKFDRCNEGITEAKRLQSEEQKVIDAESIQAISDDPRIGMIYCLWKPKYSFSRETIPSGLTGICEVATDEHKKLKYRNYGSCQTGDLVIRYLVKSGERGKLYEAFREGKPPFGWFPNGVAPDSL